MTEDEGAAPRRDGEAQSGHPRRLPRIPSRSGRPPVQRVVFHEVAAWQRTPTHRDRARERRVSLAFEEMLVSYSESDAHGTHTAVWDADEFLHHFATRIDEEPARWLLPHLRRFALDDDVEAAVREGYAARHGGAVPPTFVCPLAR